MADTIGNRVKTYTYGSSNQKYELNYDAYSGGKVVLYRVDRVGMRQQRIPVYEHGLLNSTGKDDPNLNDGGDIKSHVFQDIERDISKAYNNAGGNVEGAVFPSFISQANPELVPALNAEAQKKRIQSGVSAYADDYGLGDQFFNGGLSAQYPIDALYSTVASDAGNATDGVVRGGDERQDHLNISQYKYKVPRAKNLFSGKNKKDLLLKGIERTSPLKKFLGLVKLPMPNDITDSNNVAWGEDRMNSLEAAGIAEFGKIQGGDATVIGTGMVAEAFGLQGATSGAVIAKILGDKRIFADFKQAEKAYGAEATSRILAMAGIEAEGRSILARGKGVIPNTNLELLFNAPMLREFQFVYKMSPRSKNEATVVNQIVRFFKQGMAAKKLKQTSGDTGGTSFFLGTPNVFRLQYRTTNNDAPHGVNRIKTCALTGTSINYSPEGAWAAYEGGQPVSILMTLRFQELEPIYDTDYSTYNKGKNIRTTDTDLGNVWSIRSNEVGY